MLKKGALAITFLVLILFLIPSAFSEIESERQKPEHKITLKSREFIPERGIPADVQAALATSGLPRVHVIIQFEDIPDENERQSLENIGVKILNPIPNYAYLASLPANAIAGIANNPNVRAIVDIKPGDKISAHIAEGFGEWSKDSNGNIFLTLKFFDDVNEGEINGLISKYSAEILDRIPLINTVVISTSEEKISQIANEDIVEWVEQAPLPLGPTNDGSRAAINVNVLQNAPYNLDGTGVDVLVFDVGIVNTSHPDFGGRVIKGEPGSSTEYTSAGGHETHVAGTCCGAGTMSGGRLRGMATNVDIISYRYENCTPRCFYNYSGDMQTDWDQAINTYGADHGTASLGSNVGPNGYPCSWEGDYETTSILIDNIVTGSLGKRLPTTWAAGNERGWACGATYNTIPPPAANKNAIVVGATNSNDNSMTTFSSWGPVDDGRLKPDVVAAGCQSTGDGGINSTVYRTWPSTSYYTVKCGTSMATPAVAGVSALMIQQWRSLRGYVVTIPWPSTIKAVMVQTATDLWNAGPDYRFGYGHVDAQAAVDLIINDYPNQELIRQQTISADDEWDWYNFSVPDGVSSFRVTLVWDDPAATPLSGDDLVNDLDLDLYDPDGNHYYAYSLNPAIPGNPAVNNTWNFRDNVEQVEVQNPIPGRWRVRVWGWVVPSAPQIYTLVTPYEDVECGNTIYNDLVLGHDLNCPGTALYFGENNTALDCNGHVISGSGTGYGIYALGKYGIDIVNCNITNFNTGIYLQDSDSFWVSNNNVYLNTFKGIYVGSSEGGWVFYNRFWDDRAFGSGYGVHLFNSDNDIVYYNDVRNSYRGIFLEDSDLNLVWVNMAYNNTLYGVFMTGTSNTNSISYNELFNNQFGIRIYTSGADNTLVANNIYSNTNDGIFLFKANYTTLYSNTIYDNYDGLWIQDTGYIQAVDNVIANSTSYGIYIEGGGRNNVSKNNVSNNSYGIYGTNTALNYYYTNKVCGNAIKDIMQSIPASWFSNDNMCDKVTAYSDLGQVLRCDWQCSGCRNPEDDLYVNSDMTLCPGFYNIEDNGDLGVVIINNDNVDLYCNKTTLNGTSTGSGWGIHNPGYDSVSVVNCTIQNYFIGIAYETGSDSGYIHNNTVSSTSGGIRLWGSDYGSIYKNTVNSNTQYGIVVTQDSNYNWVVDNDADSNSLAGLVVYLSDNNIAWMNEFDMNSYGIQLYNSNSTIVYNNTLLRNTYGVYSDNSDEGFVWYNNINNNTVRGIYFDAASNVNDVSFNRVCSNNIDIHDADANFGLDNTCDTTNNWDDNETTGCMFLCTGPCYDYTIGQYIKPPTEGWNVTHEIECINTTITLNGNLNIDGNLTFRGVTLRMNATDWGEFSIDVNNGGGFFIDNFSGRPSEITNGDNSSVSYNFHINDGSRFRMLNSIANNAGYAWNLPNFDDAGIWVQTDNTTFENNTIYGNHFIGIMITNSVGHKIKNNEIYSNNWDGIYIENSANNTITKNEIYSNGDDGIVLSNSPNSTVNENYVHNNGDHGIYLALSSNLEVNKNTVNSNGYDGIIFSSNSGRITNNIVNSNYNGIVVSSSPFTPVFSNTVNSNSNVGISIGNSQNITAVNNTANSNGNVGVAISSSSNSQVKNNTASSNAHMGISLSSSPDSVVGNNTAELNWEKGIQVYSSDRTAVLSNRANLNGVGHVAENGQGIHVAYSVNVLLDKNRANSNTWSGIHFSDTNSSEIRYNTINSNAGKWDTTGLYLDVSSENLILRNEINSNTLGAKLYKSPRNRIEENQVNDNGGAGISLERSGLTPVVNNTALRNFIGISLSDSDYLEIILNRVHSNGGGIYLSSSDFVNITNNNASQSSNIGIYLGGSTNDKVINNSAEKSKYGIYLSSSSSNNVTNNGVKYNNYGISLVWSSNGNAVAKNDVRSSVNYAAYMTHSNNNVIDNNDLSSSGGIGARLEWSNANTIANNDLRWSNNYGISMLESDRNILETNDVRFSSDIGIELDSSNDNNVTDNWAEQSATGISVRFSDDNELKSNKVDSNNFGISLYQSGSNLLENNNASSSNNVGIELKTSNRNSITSNLVNSNSNDGIFLYSSHGNTLTGNDVNENSIGISLEYSKGNLISFNTVNLNDLVGIVLDKSSDSNILTQNNVESNNNINIKVSKSGENTISNNAVSLGILGISLDWSSHNKIKENNADDNSAHGISLEWYSENNSIEKNNASFSVMGISLQWSGNNNLTENYASQNLFGVGLQWYSNNNILKNNLLENNSYYGIYTAWFSDNNTMTGNIITSSASMPESSGMLISDSSGSVVSENEIARNSYGIFLNNAPDNYFSANNITYNDVGFYLYNTSTTDNFAYNNSVCYNTQDINNAINDPSNTGDENTCNTAINWNDMGTTGCTYSCAAVLLPESVNLSLLAGWNLISIPPVSENMTVKNIFTGINYGKIFTYENNNYIEIDENEKINLTKGYWINVSDDYNLTLTGAIPGPIEFNLALGYNLIGYPSLIPDNITNILPSVQDDVINILTYDGVQKEWQSYSFNKSDELNTLQTMKPGQGYFINLNKDVTWVFDGNYTK